VPLTYRGARRSHINGVSFLITLPSLKSRETLDILCVYLRNKLL
jgi:hypothetical protein